MKEEKGCTENFLKCFYVVRSLPFHHFSALGRLLVFNCVLYEDMFQVPRALLSDGHCYLICNWYDRRVAFGATIARDCTVQHSSCARSFPYTIISYFLFTALAVLSFQNGEWVILSHSSRGFGWIQWPPNIWWDLCFDGLFFFLLQLPPPSCLGALSSCFAIYHFCIGKDLSWANLV